MKKTILRVGQQMPADMLFLADRRQAATFPGIAREANASTLGAFSVDMAHGGAAILWASFELARFTAESRVAAANVVQAFPPLAAVEWTVAYCVVRSEALQYVVRVRVQ